VKSPAHGEAGIKTISYVTSDLDSDLEREIKEFVIVYPGEGGTDVFPFRIVDDASFQVEGDLWGGLPVQVEVGTDAFVIVGGKGVAIENVVLVGIDPGVVGIGVKIGDPELCFDFGFAEGMDKILVDQKTMLFGGCFEVSGIVEAGA
jgi:hypothetical protein